MEASSPDATNARHPKLNEVDADYNKDDNLDKLKNQIMLNPPEG